MQNMVMAAWSMGVGSCWVGSFGEDNAKKLLNIPDKWKVVAFVTFGYPAEQPKPRNKKAFEDLFGFEQF